MTDGEVSDWETVVDEAKKSGHRIFTVGVGSAVSEAFVRELAAGTGGVCELVSPREGMAYVVVGKDLARNRLVVGWDRVDSPGLYACQCVVGTLSDLSGDLCSRRRVEAQPRYRARAEPAALRPLAGGRVAAT